MSNNVVCDICSGRISSPHGYLLTTLEVVSAPKYWQHYYRFHKDEFAALGVRAYKDFSRDRRLWCVAIVGQSTPWIVCEKCISMFSINQNSARNYAEQWWKSKGTFQPPGTGPAPLSAINM